MERFSVGTRLLKTKQLESLKSSFKNSFHDQKQLKTKFIEKKLYLFVSKST
jgi:hypothetical protein